MENYLPVDLNHTGFQFIHLDMVRSYGIACKFKRTSECEFNITDMMLVSTSPFGRKHYKVSGNQGYACRSSNTDSDYGYEMSVKITNEEYEQNNPESCLFDNQFLPAVYNETGSVDKKCVIDLHIKGENFGVSVVNEDTTIESPNKITFGTRFCKFYIL